MWVVVIELVLCVGGSARRRTRRSLGRQGGGRGIGFGQEIPNAERRAAGEVE